MTNQQTRKNRQWLMAPLVPLVIIGGFIWPYLGYIAITLMALMMALALFRGRYYCSWICPMGAFHERILSTVSLHKKMLPVFKKSWFKWTIFILMMSLLTTRLLLTNGDPSAVGAVFVMMWTLSTALAIGIGLIWKPRSWCSICPMALSQGFLSPKTYRLQVADSCKQCGLCQRACPIETYPGAYKDKGYVKSSECMRCGTCIKICPGHTLSLPDKK
jgi:polyferredoxin